MFLSIFEANLLTKLLTFCLLIIYFKSTPFLRLLLEALTFPGGPWTKAKVAILWIVFQDKMFSSSVIGLMLRAKLLYFISQSEGLYMFKLVYCSSFSLCYLLETILLLLRRLFGCYLSEKIMFRCTVDDFRPCLEYSNPSRSARSGSNMSLFFFSIQMNIVLLIKSKTQVESF